MSGAAVLGDSISVAFGSTTVLANVDLQLSAGRSLALSGPSGSGKSTLLGCITGTVKPQRGRVQVGDVVVSDLNPAAAADYRRASIGLMFQQPELLPELTVEENVALTQIFDGIGRRTALRASHESLDHLGMLVHARKRIDELSGGEAQRVALARALSRPNIRLLVADEPTASLDAGNAAAVTAFLVERCVSLGVTLIVATHDPSVADAMSDRTELAMANAAGAIA